MTLQEKNEKETGRPTSCNLLDSLERERFEQWYENTFAGEGCDEALATFDRYQKIITKWKRAYAEKDAKNWSYIKKIMELEADNLELREENLALKKAGKQLIDGMEKQLDEIEKIAEGV